MADLIIKEAIKRLTEKRDLDIEEAEESMKEIVSGEATPAQIAAFLVALKMKGETASEISSFAQIARNYSIRIDPKVDGRLIDTCGTGGDRVKTFNVSTITAFILSAAGLYVAKHGNRSVSGICGSADLLEAFGVNLDCSPKVVEACIEKIGIGFIFAPRFHPSFRHALTPRREIGVRTVFNILGPLCNPAGANIQLVGVYEPHLTGIVAEALRNLGVSKALVYHGLEGLDEISISGPTVVAEVDDSEIRSYQITPEDFGLKRDNIEKTVSSTLDESVKTAVQILNNSPDIDHVKKELVLLNSAAGLKIAGLADTFEEGIMTASNIVEDGGAYEKLKLLVEESGGDSSKLEELESRYV